MIRLPLILVLCCCGLATSFLLLPTMTAPTTRTRTSSSQSSLIPLFLAKKKTSGRKDKEPIYIRLEPNGSDVWRCMEFDLPSVLEQNGIVVMPIDQGYGIVCSLEAGKKGIDRLIQCYHGTDTIKPAISLVAPDLSTIGQCCYNISPSSFKLLKQNLPSSQKQFQLLACAKALPKSHFKSGSKVVVSMSEDPVLANLQADILGGMPLLCVMGLPNSSDDDADMEEQIDCSVDYDASWCRNVDVILDTGVRPSFRPTIYDLTGFDGPQVVDMDNSRTLSTNQEKEMVELVM